MKYVILIFFAFSLTSCAWVQNAFSKNESAEKTNSEQQVAQQEQQTDKKKEGKKIDPLANLHEAHLPNGSMTTCKVLEAELDVSGQKWSTVEIFNGLAKIALPKSDDWKFQCDQKFWAFSVSNRVQLTISPYQVKPTDPTNMKDYVTMLAQNALDGLKNTGIEAKPPQVTELAYGKYQATSILRAPKDKEWKLFPQVSFWSAQNAALSHLNFDVHMTWFSTEDTDDLRKTVKNFSAMVTNFQNIEPEQ